MTHGRSVKALSCPAFGEEIKLRGTRNSFCGFDSSGFTRLIVLSFLTAFSPPTAERYHDRAKH